MAKSRAKSILIMERILILVAAATLALCAFLPADGQTVIAPITQVTRITTEFIGGYIYRIRATYLINTLTGETVALIDTEIISVRRALVL